MDSTANELRDAALRSELRIIRTDNWDKSTFLLLAFFVSVFVYLCLYFILFMRLQIAIIFVFRGQH